ncbi:MAG TPA: helix-hairpin-helix domain-containing protein [Solirubrobacteraceae bacterium]|nr:helix-hairpin-helix domain-containing protein [Solirubrobacteraceae bacterium]
MTNAELADRLEAFAVLLELAERNPYTIRAYRRAAATVRDAPAPVAELVATGRVQSLRGIGPGIAGRLQELVSTGQIAELAELERVLSPEMVGIGRYLGLSAERSLSIAQTLGVRTLAELRAAAAEGRLREVPGIGPKFEARILSALDRPRDQRERAGLMLDRARALVTAIATALGGEIAGDPRRWRETCAELAVVVAAREPGPVIARFAVLPEVVAVIDRDERSARGVTVDGVAVALTVAAPEAFGTAWVRATGSAEYVSALGPLPEAENEAAVYAGLGLPWCPPELREAPGPPAPLPALIELEQIRGDLHAHTTYSDGRFSVAEMGRAARERGYDYLAICDHTPAVGAVRGLTPEDLRRQAQEIAAANADLAPFRVLRGIECDILSDGSLDLPDAVLDQLDWVQVSVHGGQRMPRAEMTRRVTAALEHDAVSCLSHPTGRLLGRRPESALDLDAVYALAAARGIALEVNGLPARLDLSAEHVRRALAGGVRIVCSTDAHSLRGLGNMELAVATARRGGATAADVVNTGPVPERASRSW